ncbi:unnamed protein product [Cuscuta epithymum]|uniref:TF-B3 domain-containing protein n=1 Tax=Cuscuta epithymum TaxID=186058 RepID=A0AAV0D8Z6_9ASTE|nr:unnamed protein product [Cuscuta epithymum]
MEEELQRFFKVLMPGFETKLMLPPVICEKLRGIESKGTIMLESQKGRWVVQIAKCEEGNLWLTEGWNKFVRQHELEVGDFVVFKRMGRSMQFKVTLFDRSCCEKDHCPSGGGGGTLETNNDSVSKVEVNEEDAHVQRHTNHMKSSMKGKMNDVGIDGAHSMVLMDVGRKRGRPKAGSIVLQSQKQHMSPMRSYNVRKQGPYLNIPREFCVANGYCQNTRVTLKGPIGDCKVTLLVNKCAFFSQGWREFVEINRVEEGDICIIRPRDTTSSKGGRVFDIEVLRVGTS